MESGISGLAAQPNGNSRWPSYPEAKFEKHGPVRQTEIAYSSQDRFSSQTAKETYTRLRTNGDFVFDVQFLPILSGPMAGSADLKRSH